MSASTRKTFLLRKDTLIHNCFLTSVLFSFSLLSLFFLHFTPLSTSFFHPLFMFRKFVNLVCAYLHIYSENNLSRETHLHLIALHHIYE